MIKIKPHRQSSGFCGPSSLKMIAEYYGIQKTEKELGVLSKCTEEKGSTAENLLSAARKIGLNGFYKDDSSLSEIRKFISKGIPVIVDWFSINDGHYSVVAGIDKKFIYLQDPELGKINKIALQTFNRVWFDFKGDYLKSAGDLYIRRMIVITKN